MASAVIGNLRVNLGIDSAEFQNGAKKAQSTLAGLTGSLKAFAVGAVGALSLAGLAGAVKSAANHMDELSKSAQRMGVSVEALSRLEYSARLADVSLGDLQTGFAQLSRQMAQLQSGASTEAGKALQAIGVSATDASGKLKSVDMVLGEVADRFSTYQDGANKTAIAMALFGRSGAQLIPLLNQGSEALREQSAEAERLGLVVSTNTAQAAEQFNDNLTRLKAAAEGVTNQITEAMIPGMVNLTNAMVDFSQEGVIVEQVSAAINFVMRETAIFLSNASAAWAEITAYVEAAGKAFDALTNMDFSGMGAAWAESQQKVADAWAQNAENVARIRGEIQSVNRALKGDLGTATRRYEAPPLPEVARNVAAVRDQIKKTIPPAKELKTEFDEIGGAAVNMGDEISSALAPVFRGWLDDAIDGTFKLKTALGELVKKLGEMAIDNVFTGLFGGGGTGGSGLLGGLLGGLFGGFSGFYAQGGRIPTGGWGIVGEAGPEVVAGPASVIPNGALGGMGATTIHVVLSDDLRAEVDQKVNSGMRQAVQVSVAESSRMNRRQFGSNYREAQVRQF